MVSGFNALSLDNERLLVRFISFGSELYDSCFVCLKSRSAPFLLIECFIDNCFNTFPITLRSWSSHLRGKIIYERACSSLAVDLCTRSALKKRNRIGDSGERCGSPACGRLWTSDNCLLIWTVAVRSEQNVSTHRSRSSGMPCAFIL